MNPFFSAAVFVLHNFVFRLIQLAKPVDTTDYRIIIGILAVYVCLCVCVCVCVGACVVVHVGVHLCPHNGLRFILWQNSPDRNILLNKPRRPR